AYEYRVERVFTALYQAPYVDSVNYGYVYAGRALPLVESRGTALLVIDSSVIDTTLHPDTAEQGIADIDQYKQDLVGDGWAVREAVEEDIDRGVERDKNEPNHDPTDPKATDASQAILIRNIINDAYFDAGSLESIVLIGHVPVPYS